MDAGVIAFNFLQIKLSFVYQRSQATLSRIT